MLAVAGWPAADHAQGIDPGPGAARGAGSPAAAADVPQPQAEAAELKGAAVAVAREVADAYPDDALSYALLGSAYYNTGQSDEATRHLRRCLELDPAQAEAYGILGLIAYAKGQPQETARLCRKALERGAPNPDILNRLGRALMDLGRTAEAIEALEQAVALPFPVAESSYLLGQACLQAGDLARAKETFLRTLRLQPDHTQAAFGLYTACLRLGQDGEAARHRETFQRLEAADRRSLTDRSTQEETRTGLPQVRRVVARTQFGAAQVHRAHGNPGRAAQLFLEAAALDPDNPAYRAALESLYAQARQFDAGVKTFQQLIAVQPTNGWNYYFLGRLHGRLDQPVDAERCYRKFQELSPGRPEPYRALAELYLRSDARAAEARVMARKAVELEPSAAHHFLLAMACWRDRDRQEALQAVQRAVALDPENRRYQQFLEQLPPAP